MRHLRYAVIFILTLAGCASLRQTGPVWNEGECHFFRCDFADSTFLVLLSNGRYYEIDRTHLQIFVSDRGTWRMSGSEVVIRSEERVRDIKVGGLEISGITFSTLEEIEPLEAALKAFLAKNPAEEFERDVVEGIYGVPLYGFEPMPGIDVDPEIETVPRRLLVRLLEGIRKQKADETRSVFRKVLLSDGGEQYLCDPDEEYCRALNWAFLRRIDKAEFFEAMMTTQPFIFIPQMNDLVDGQTDFPEYKEIYEACH